jgi:hypothetical protein
MATKHPIYPLSSDIVDSIAALWPDAATYIGIHDYDARWPNLSPDGAAESIATLGALRRRVASLPPPDDRWSAPAVTVNLDTLAEELGPLEHGDYLADLNSIASPLQSLRESFDQMPTTTRADWEDICARLEGLEPAPALHGVARPGHLLPIRGALPDRIPRRNASPAGRRLRPQGTPRPRARGGSGSHRPRPRRSFRHSRHQPGMIDPTTNVALGSIDDIGLWVGPICGATNAARPGFIWVKPTTGPQCRPQP